MCRESGAPSSSVETSNWFQSLSNASTSSCCCQLTPSLSEQDLSTADFCDTDYCSPRWTYSSLIACDYLQRQVKTLLSTDTDLKASVYKMLATNKHTVQVHVYYSVIRVSLSFITIWCRGSYPFFYSCLMCVCHIIIKGYLLAWGNGYSTGP